MLYEYQKKPPYLGPFAAFVKHLDCREISVMRTFSAENLPMSRDGATVKPVASKLQYVEMSTRKWVKYLASQGMLFAHPSDLLRLAVKTPNDLFGNPDFAGWFTVWRDKAGKIWSMSLGQLGDYRGINISHIEFCSKWSPRMRAVAMF